MSFHLKGKGIVSYIKTTNNAFFNLIYEQSLLFFHSRMFFFQFLI